MGISGREAVIATPAPPLGTVIRRYVGYRSVGTPAVHRGLPSGALTFIISLADPVDIAAMPAGLQGPGRYQALVGGLHAAPAYIRHQGFQCGLSLELTPLGARNLLGVPAGELANAVVHLDELAGPAARGLVDRLGSAAGWRERFSAEVGYSRRHLAELFRRELGLAPKTAARVLRFDRSRRLIAGSERPALAQVAAAAGYYDQAHMTREWSEIAGCAPTTSMAEELPSVQDEPVVLEASCGHDDDRHAHGLARPALS
jgi:AraC-like DNA-binding protein